MSEKGVDWSNPEERKAYRKAYQKRYYEANKEKWKAYYEANIEQRKAYHKKYRETHKEELTVARREYGAKHRVTKFVKYVGVCTCPKCGRKGYKSYLRQFNNKSGNYGRIYTRVIHQHKADGKTVYDGQCYIGMGEL